MEYKTINVEILETYAVTVPVKVPAYYSQSMIEVSTAEEVAKVQAGRKSPYLEAALIEQEVKVLYD